MNEIENFGRTLIRGTPGEIGLHMRMVRTLRCAKERDLALMMCNAALDIDGDQHLIRLNRAYLLLERGLTKEAQADLDVAACADTPFEERLVGAAARRDPLGPIVREYFDPADATFDATSIDAANVVTSLRRFGCAWIKGLFKPRDLSFFDAIIAENIAGIERLGDYHHNGYPLYFASLPDRERIQAIYAASAPDMFNPERMADGNNTALAHFVFASLESSGLDRALSAYLGIDPLYTSASICHIRSFKPKGLNWFGEFHQDNRLYNSDAEILTLWFPFRYQHGPMPSLEFVPIKSKSHLPCASDCGILPDLFEPEAFWRPAYELGDAMLISGFSPHRTYIESDMTMERTSIDFRLFASKVPHPIFAPVIEPASRFSRLFGKIGR